MPLIDILKRWDKHLWGCNASFKEAIKIIGLSDTKEADLERELFEFKNVEVELSGGEVKNVRRREWLGKLEFWQSPDRKGGKRTPYRRKGGADESNSLSRRQWEKMVLFVENHQTSLSSDDVTLKFAIRLLRRNRLAANQHTVAEVFNLRRIPIRAVPFGEPMKRIKVPAMA